MNILKNQFLASVLCIVGTVCYTGSVDAKDRSTGAGKYWVYNVGQVDCLAGCYCTGHGDDYSGCYVNECNISKDKPIIRNGSCSNEKNGFLGIYACPSSHPKSDTGSKSSSQCYYSCDGGGRIYYGVKKECSSGQYIPKGSNDCKACPDDGKSYCVGVNNYGPACSGASQDWGLHTCDEGKKPNSAKNGCTDKAESCSEGTYLPANSKTCAACPDGWVCKGGEYYPNKTEPRDRFKERCSGKSIPNETKTACKDCAAGTKPNEDNTECVEGDAITVAPGYYLKKNSETQTACPPTMPETKYCPGGEFKFSKTEDQGQQDCPYSSKRRKGYTTKCDLTLNKEQMECGIKGIEGRKDKDSDKSRAAASCTSTPCWVKINAEDYINCVYGIRFEIGSDEEEK